MIRTGLIASLAAVAVCIGAWLWLSQALPPNIESVPVHWGMDGQADGFASRADALRLLLLLPGAAVVMTLLFSLIPFIEPLGENLRRSRQAYVTAWIGAMAMIALVTVGVAVMTARAAGGADSPESVDIFVRGILAGAALLIVLIGNVLPKTRPNFFLGVRTPWTLTSDLSWERTHRFAGRLMVLIGLWGVVAAFTLRGVALAFALAAPLIAAMLIAVVYSYFVWRADPNRRRPAQEA